MKYTGKITIYKWEKFPFWNEYQPSYSGHIISKTKQLINNFTKSQMQSEKILEWQNKRKLYPILYNQNELNLDCVSESDSLFLTQVYVDFNLIFNDDDFIEIYDSWNVYSGGTGDGGWILFEKYNESNMFRYNGWCKNLETKQNNIPDYNILY